MAITLLRHFSPIYPHRYWGWSNIPIDTTECKDLNLGKFDYIYSSDLQRCQQTLEYLGYTYQIDSRLREIRFRNEIEGKNFDEIQKLTTFSMNYLESYDVWSHYICDETLEEFYQRIQQFFDELPLEQEILICSHAGVLRYLDSYLTNNTTSLSWGYGVAKRYTDGI